MRKFIKLWPLLVIVGLLSSCETDNGNETGPVNFELSSAEISVSQEGGQYEMRYTLENPVDTASVRASCGESWVYRFTDAGNAVTFFVAANEADSVRTADVVVTYMDVTCEFTVTQEALPAAPAPSFEITIKDVTYNSVSYEVIPSDKEMTYIPDRCSRRTYWDLFTPEETPDRFIQEQLDYLQGWSDYIGIDVSDYISQQIEQGDLTDGLFDNLEADKEYVLFVYGINTEMEVLSGLFWEYFTTEDVTPSDNELTVTVPVPDITANSARVMVTTTNDDPYVVGADLAANWAGMSNEEILEVLTGDSYDVSRNVQSGDYDATFYNLTSGTDYIVFVFGFDAGKATTELQTYPFTTKSVQGSELQFIDIEYGDAFDIDDVIAMYGDEYPVVEEWFTAWFGTGRIYLPMRAVVSEDAAEYLWAFDWQDLSDPKQHSDGELITMLTEWGMAVPYEEYDGYFPDYNSIGTVFGVCIDEDGKYGPVYRETIYLTEKDITPATEFPIEEFVASHSSSAVSPAVRNYVEIQQPYNVIEPGFDRADNTFRR